MLRLVPGAAVTAFNASAGEWLCRLGDAGHGRAMLAVERRLRPPEQENDVWLLFAPLKRVRLDWLIEKATELGAAALVPVWTERTQPERLNRDRLGAIAIAASEQSERLSVPQSLTLSANSPLLPGSGSARGCCAPRPPLLLPWRFFRRSPEIGAAPGRGDPS